MPGVLVALIANLIQVRVTWEELPDLGNCQDQIGFVSFVHQCGRAQATMCSTIPRQVILESTRN